MSAGKSAPLPDLDALRAENTALKAERDHAIDAQIARDVQNATAWRLTLACGHYAHGPNAVATSTWCDEDGQTVPVIAAISMLG